MAMAILVNSVIDNLDASNAHKTTLWLTAQEQKGPKCKVRPLQWQPARKL